jgi:ABC-type transporter Mla MlaB component
MAMLRVDARRVQAGVFELLVSGTLDAERVSVLRQALDDASARARTVSLNLGGIVGIDREGMAALVDWSGRGARLVECPPFLRRWIRDERASRIREQS